jgi:hypothetical protein
MAKQIRSDRDFGLVARILNLPAAQSANEPVTLAQLSAAIEATAWKDNVRVATTANININAPGASIDGVALTVGDRVLVKNQTAQAENGIRIFNGAAAVMTRALDASTSDELENAFVPVDEGASNAQTVFRQTQVNFVLDTNPVIFTSAFNSSPAASETVAGIAEVATQAETDTGTDDLRFITPLKLAQYVSRYRRFEALIGDASSTQFDVSHNLNSRDVSVTVYRNATPWDDIEVDVERPDANTVRLRFATGAPPAAAQFRVCVKL